MDLSRLWRQKQLEYTWLLSLMGRYESFESVTRRALDYCLDHFRLDRSDAQREALCDEYLRGSKP